MSQENVEVVRSHYEAFNRRAIREYFQAFWEAAAEVLFEADEFIEHGDEVIVPGRLVGRFRVTGIEASRLRSCTCGRCGTTS
jgi:hypothetical protein